MSPIYCLRVLSLMFVYNVKDVVHCLSDNEVLQPMEVGVANMLAAKSEESGCVVMDGLCLEEEDLSNYEAIKSLHKLLDDDKSGEIDMNESVDFLMEELTITDGFNSRQKNLHHNSDSFISVQDLWHMWLRSEVHNWTVDDTVHWMEETVGLYQYSDALRANNINGSYLPRLTMNKSNYLGSVLGIKSLSHRTKVTVKAMDAVLFGPPKGNRLKDMLIAGLVTVILLGASFLIMWNRRMRAQYRRLIRQMEDLQQEEDKYRKTQRERRESEAAPKKQEATADVTAEDAPVTFNVGSGSTSDVSSTNDIPAQSTTTSRDYDLGEYDSNDDDDNVGSVTPPNTALKYWLSKTYFKERKLLDNKSKQAHAQMEKAKDVCGKLKAQGKNPLSLFSLMHGKIGNVEKTIYLAREGMHDVKKDEKELQERWGEIERLMECNIRGEAELQSVISTYASLQNNLQNSGGAETPSIDGSSSMKAGSSIRSTAASSLRGGGGGGASLQHSYTATGMLHQGAPEFQRQDDDTDSVSLPRCSSFGSSATRQLPSFASHQQLTEPYQSEACSNNNNGRQKAPQKRPRRHKPSSLVKPLTPHNGVIPSSASDSNRASVADAAISLTGATTPGSASSHTSGNKVFPGCTIDGSVHITSPTTPLSEKQDIDVALGAEAQVRCRGVTGSASDPVLGSSPAAATASDESSHRTLAQDGGSSGGGSELTTPKQRTKKMSFFDRLKSGRKSVRAAGSKS